MIIVHTQGDVGVVEVEKKNKKVEIVSIPARKYNLDFSL